ncbi:MAG: glycerate 2-kinase [Sphingomonadales bacterium]|jgi:hydroxypyruvate reductase|nr:glycerate 2-kinase [Sphingomonadales bacterium]
MSRAHLEAIWRVGVEACLPERVLPPHLPEPPPGRTIILALGKAAVPMARVVEARWRGPLSGLAVAPHSGGGTLERVDVIRAAHPVPDESSVEAARRLLALAGQAERDDLVLVLLSGGASSLACQPGDGLGLAEKRRLTEALLRSGASVSEINRVRRHLSRFKGGRLALAASPARLATLAISDVVGDRPADIGSGPTAADPSTVEEARAVLDRYAIAAPDRGWSETLKRVSGEWRLVAGAADALAAAAARARELGYAPRLLECEGEAREVGRAHAALALAAGPGIALISGGELTVTVCGPGRGGPNQEYALAAALELSGETGICGLAADTDGIDGSSEAAGAFFGCGAPGGEAALEANDSDGWFSGRGGLFVTGPTETNVSDLRIILT